MYIYTRFIIILLRKAEKIYSIGWELYIMEEKLLSINSIEDLVEMIPGGYYIYKADMSEELLFVNKAAIQIYGCETLEEFKEFTGYTFPGLVHPDDIDDIEGIIWEQVKSNAEKYDYVKYRITRKDGEVRTVADYGKLVETEEYGPVFCVFIFDTGIVE